MQRRPVILTFVRHYLPGYKSGGPVRTISNLVEALGDEFEFRIVTSDRDFLDERPYRGIRVNAWRRVGKAQVYYASPERQNVRSWMEIMCSVDHDVLYLNSLFDEKFTLLPLLARRLSRGLDSSIVLAPRGEFSPGALAIKRWKKKPFLRLAGMLGLYRDVIWHATTHEEEALIRSHFPACRKVVVAGNLPSMPASFDLGKPEEDGDHCGPLRVVFLSRISRMKNLDFAIRVLAEYRFDIQFDIWGTKEDPAYWRECEALIASLPVNIRAEYRGMADHSDVHAILAGYDLFFLPTRGENFGHVIAEALSVGLPVLISDQTPWRGLEKAGVGWDLPLDDPARFARAIAETKERVSTGRVEWRKQVLQYARARLQDPQTRHDNVALFRSAVRIS